MAYGIIDVAESIEFNQTDTGDSIGALLVPDFDLSQKRHAQRQLRYVIDLFLLPVDHNFDQVTFLNQRDTTMAQRRYAVRILLGFYFKLIQMLNQKLAFIGVNNRPTLQ